MSLATLNGTTVVRGSLMLPGHGVPWASVELDQEVELSGAVTLALGDLSQAATVVSGGPFRGGSQYWIAGGAGGWGREIPEKDYVNDAGVQRQTVLRDAAREVGETIGAIPIASIGTKWVRERGPASATLDRLFPEVWHVDAAGVTQLSRRARTEPTLDVTISSHDKARGIIKLAADSISKIVPGAVIDGSEAVDVLHELEGRTLRATVWTKGEAAYAGTVADLRALVESFFPDLPFRGVTEYRVVSPSGERWNLQPVRTSHGMPALRHVRVRPGVAGCKATLTLGSLVLVAFVDADPGRPVIISHSDKEGPGFAPSRLDLVGTDDLGVTPLESIGRVVRYGDPIAFSGPGPGAVTLPAPASLSRVRA